MRHKYTTKGIVLARYTTSEANADIVILTQELGLLRARAQGIRKSGAKLSSALQTFVESDVVLVRGKDGWRIVGAILDTNWFSIFSQEMRTRAGRITSLILRMVPGENVDFRLYNDMQAFFGALIETPSTLHEAVECMSAIRLVHFLGFDAGELPSSISTAYDYQMLAQVERNRGAYITRINYGITASGL